MKNGKIANAEKPPKTRKSSFNQHSAVEHGLFISGPAILRYSKPISPRRVKDSLRLSHLTCPHQTAHRCGHSVFRLSQRAFPPRQRAASFWFQVPVRRPVPAGDKYQGGGPRRGNCHLAQLETHSCALRA